MSMRVLRSRVSALAAASISLLALSAAAAPLHQEPVLAASANDPKLVGAIARLSPTIRLDEAALVARCAFETGRELRHKWRVVWPPGLQNFLVHRGARPGGLCFQWAEELLVRLYGLKLQSIDLHWAEANMHSDSEHNVIVVTAHGQPFAQGVLLDNWRYGGRLAWGPVREDTQYPWRENPAHFSYVLFNKFRSRTQPHSQQRGSEKAQSSRSAPDYRSSAIWTAFKAAPFRS
jgi:hypothetical protein